MSHRGYTIADTCFLIDWSKYRYRDILFKIFRTVFVPEEVLREIKSEDTITWISRELARDNLSLYTVSRFEIDEARRLIEISREKPHLPSIDLPEAICLVIGRTRGYVVLTENRGALYIPRSVDEYRDVVVWRSLELLVNAVLYSILKVDCGSPDTIFKEYMRDTLHLFPRKALEEAVERVRRYCLERRF